MPLADQSAAVASSAGAQRAPGTRYKARGIWLQAHLWTGLVVGFVVALTGLSGSLLVFSGPLLRAEQGAVVAPDPATLAPKMAGAAAGATVETWIARTRARYPDLHTIDSVVAPGAAPVASSVPLLVAHAESEAHVFEGHIVVGIDPVSGEPLGKFLFEATWAGKIMSFHIDLLAATFGSQVVAWCGLAALVVSLGTGLYLWWPAPGRWRRALWFRSGARGRRRLLDLHNVATVWLLVPLIIVLASGLYIVRPGWFDPGLRLVSDIREPDFATLKDPRRARCGGGLGVDAALALALRDRPGWRLRLMAIPEDVDEPYYIGLMRDGGDPKVMATELWIDRHCPTVLFARLGDGLTAGELIKSWNTRMHADLGLGAAGQALVFLTGLLLPLLWITGLLLWLARRTAGSRPTRAN